MRLIEAVGTVLARDGFRALGVNAVAREAGVDKVLIYRYFGGLPQLLRAFGEQGQFWPTDDELIGPDPDALLALDAGRRWAHLVTNAVRGIRRRPLTHEILRWEMVESNELTRILQELRETQYHRIMRRFGSDIPIDSAVPTATALVVAATNYLLARRQTIDMFAGLDLHTEESWQHVEATIERLILCASQGPSEG